MSGNPDTRDEVLSLLARAPGTRPAFLGPNALDHMFSMLMELAAQQWVLRERLYGQERLLEQAGVLAPEALEAWAPSAAQAAQLARMREETLRELFRCVLAREAPAGLPPHTDDPAPPG